MIKAMKKIRRIFTAVLLCITMALLPSGTALAKSTGNQQLYISEVKVGMGETSEEAAAELLAEGYTILTENGQYADLNYRTGTNSGMKKGPTEKVVYIGYKTTSDPNDAITDLAVMNMNGGYSTQDYQILMENYMEGQIKPFVNRFIAALKEYRENYYKPEGTLNHIRADYYRQMLNKLTDDDTGGQPLGDLLLNLTKYEMGDAAYNALSDAEKKNHADILTLLMQGNGRAVLLLETLVTKSADSAEDTWLDRFLATDLETLKEEIKNENPHLTTEQDICAELDRTYNDTARSILEKWDSFSEMILRYDDNVNHLINSDPTVDEDLKKKAENLDLTRQTKETANTVVNILDAEADSVVDAVAAQEVLITDFLQETAYGDDTLMEFFQKERSDFSGEGIRELYPLAASLSAGQIAGLEFLSLTDLFAMVLTTEEGYNTLDIDNMVTASFFQDVDREIYEPGGVALTNAALRQKQNKLDDDSSFLLSPLGFVYWGLTAACGIGTVVSLLKNIQYVSYQPAVEVALMSCTTKMYEMTPLVDELGIYVMKNTFWGGYAEEVKIVGDAVNEKFAEIVKELDWVEKVSQNTTLTYCLTVGFTVLTAIFAAVSIFLTVSEMLAYYKVTFAPIPKYIVDEADITETVNGKTVVTKNDTAYYKVVTCNRKEGKTDTEKDNYRVLGNSNDLNGDVGKQWLALYSVKYEQGRPILADSLMVITGTEGRTASALPNGYETGIHRFGEKAAFNLTSEYYCYNDTPNGTYVYFKQADKTVSEMTGKSTSITIGSIFSNDSLMIGAGAGAVLGAGAAIIIMTAARKRKKEEIAA